MSLSMFYKFWAIYSPKLGAIGFLLASIGFATSGSSLGNAVKFAGLTILIPLCIVGAILGIWGCFGFRTRCPKYSTPSYWVQYARRRKIGLDCKSCGLVICENFWSFELSVKQD